MFVPTKWDENEMFILGFTVFLIVIQMCLIRKFPLSVTVMIWLFNYYLVKWADLIVGVPPLNLYDLMDGPKYEWFDLLTHLTIYPILGHVFLYAYDRWKLTGMRLVTYILVWSLVSVMIEWGAVYAGVFRYNGWKLWWSYLVYVVVFVLNVVYYRKVRKWVNEIKF